MQTALGMVAELETIEARFSGGMASVEDGVRRQELEAALVRALGPGQAPEKRWHLRVPCEISARVGAESGSADGTITNLSASGAFVVSRAEVLPGEQVELTIEHGGRGVEVRGHVAWRVTDGFAVDLSSAGPERERTLRRLTLRLLRSQLV